MALRSRRAPTGGATLLLNPDTAMDFLTPRAPHDPAQIARIKTWATEVLGVDHDATILVTELRCTEPGCPPLETVIAVLRDGGAPEQHKIHRAIADVVEADVKRLSPERLT